MADISPELTVWSPHPASETVRRFKSLLERRDEEWTWVKEPLQACWIVIDASLPVNAALIISVDSSDEGRKKIALARSWAELPDNSWVFFHIPLTESTVFPLLDQLLGRGSQEHAKQIQNVAKPVSKASPWSGQRLRLRSWPNLSRYEDPHMHLVAATRRMLVGFVPYEELTKLVGDKETLDRLLGDAQHRGSLRTLLGSSQDPTPAPAQQHDAAEQNAGSSLFQRFLEKFR